MLDDTSKYYLNKTIIYNDWTSHKKKQQLKNKQIEIMVRKESNRKAIERKNKHVHKTSHTEQQSGKKHKSPTDPASHI